ncbi:MAG: APC family permease [Nitrososphaerota archaeon]|nr:APC family permease [Nitrososphaerota archaeon]
MTEQKSKVFARESTGLVKNVSLLDAVSLNVSSMSAGAALATIAFTMSIIPQVLTSYSGINLVYGSIIAFIITIPQMIVYTIMTRRLPRTGGDYVWTSRAFGGFVGSTVSFMGYTVETMAFMALIVFSTVLAIGAVLVQMGMMQYLGLAIPINFGGDGISQFVLGAIIYAILILLNIFKPKYGFKLVSATMIIGILSLVVGNAVLLSAGNHGVANYINGLGINGTTYDSVASSVTGSTFNFANTVFLMPFFAMFVYPWFVAAPAVASELKGKRSTNWNVPISALISLIIVTGSFATMYYVGGYNFITGAFFNGTLVNDYSFNFWTLAMGVSPNSAVAAFIGLGWILWNIGILAYGIIGISRYIFAQAFDRFLPEKMSYISPRFRSPVIAHVIDLVVTVVILGIAISAYGYINSLYGAIMASMIYFIFVGGAAVVFASRNEKGGMRTLLSAAGVLSALVFVFLTYQFLAYPGVWGGNAFAYGYVAASIVLGAVIYLISKSYHLKRGIDIGLAYKEIPPD